MRAATHIFGLLLAIHFLASCNKTEVPGDTIGDPVFVFSGTLNGELLERAAGADGYFMATSFDQGVDGVYNFTGSLRPANCNTDCPGALTFTLRDAVVSPTNGSSGIDQALQPAAYAYRVSAPNNTRSFPVSFTAEPFGTTPTSYLWDFGDGSTSSLPNPTHTYPDIQGQTSYEVCLTIMYNNGCSSSLCNPIYLPNSACGAKLTANEIAMGSFDYRGMATGTAPFRYSWEFTSGFSALTQDVKYVYDTMVGIDSACLTIEDATGCIARNCRNVVVDPNQVNCATNYVYQASTLFIPDPDSLDLSEVIMNWTDDSGKRFTSDNSLQPASSTFEILDVEEFDVNENGHPTRKLTIRLNCTLYNGNESVSLENVMAVIAVAYPGS